MGNSKRSNGIEDKGIREDTSLSIVNGFSLLLSACSNHIHTHPLNRIACVLLSQEAFPVSRSEAVHFMSALLSTPSTPASLPALRSRPMPQPRQLAIAWLKKKKEKRLH